MLNDPIAGQTMKALPVVSTCLVLLGSLVLNAEAFSSSPSYGSLITNLHPSMPPRTAGSSALHWKPSRQLAAHDSEQSLEFPNTHPVESSVGQKQPWATTKLFLLTLASTLLVPTKALASTAASAAPAVAAAVPVIVTAAPAATAAIELKLSFRLVYAAFMGACLGKERSFARRSAGVRTMSLVALGASAFTVCSAFGFLQFTGKCDPGRMAANVASGVGFVGAGVITTSGSTSGVVHGLTTAATIWLSAAVGVACGVGLFRVATTAAVTTILILRLGRPRRRRPPIPAPSPQDSIASTKPETILTQEPSIGASDPLQGISLERDSPAEDFVQAEDDTHHEIYPDYQGRSGWVDLQVQEQQESQQSPRKPE